MPMVTIFASCVGTMVAMDLQNKFIQTGRGIVMFRLERSSRPQMSLDGNICEPTLNGCSIIESDTSVTTLHLVGCDYAGRPWQVWVDDKPDLKYGAIWDYCGSKNARFTRKTTSEVLLGRPFAEAIAELTETLREAEITTLRERAARVDVYEAALRDIAQANTAGGPGSRAKVDKIILSVSSSSAAVV